MEAYALVETKLMELLFTARSEWRALCDGGGPWPWESIACVPAVCGLGDRLVRWNYKCTWWSGLAMDQVLHLVHYHLPHFIVVGYLRLITLTETRPVIHCIHMGQRDVTLRPLESRK